ncbi:class II aldolase/adducin family protein [Streptomyces sp. NPDC046900]|uniref:class II aldolase/adducin family protein n=1 Tax=Streptomyces sp. NPDC046900 TaxID=3155473 RepID=UPI0033E0F3AB
MTSVVHTHPRSTVVANLADIPCARCSGPSAFPPTAWPRRASRCTRAADSSARRRRAASLPRRSATPRSACLRGHGVVSVGHGVAQAVIRTPALDELARMRLRIAELGGRPDGVPPEDRAVLLDLGAAFNEQALWRYHLGRLDQRGLADAD